MFVLGLWALLPALLPTQDPAPSLESLLAALHTQSLTLEQLRAQLQAAEARRGPASAPPDPMVEAMLQDIDFPRNTVGREDMSMVGIELRQELPGTRRLRARAAVGEAERGTAEATLQRVHLELRARVRQSYAALYALDSEDETLEASSQLLEMLVSTATARYSVAAGEQEAVLRLQLEQQRIFERRSDWQAERGEAVARLNALLGREAESTLGQVRELPEIEWPQDRGLSRAPSLLEAQAVQGTAETRVARARAEARAMWSAGAGVFNRGGLDSVVTLRVGVSLPLWHDRKQAREIEAAQHDAAAASASARAMQREIDAESHALRARFDAARANALRYREGLLPLTSAALDAARSAYLAGRGEFASVLESWRAWWVVRAQLTQRETDAFVAWASFLALRGEDSL